MTVDMTPPATHDPYLAFIHLTDSLKCHWAHAVFFFNFFFYQYLTRDWKSIWATKKNVFCIFSKQENCGKHLWAVWGSSSASMERDPLHCLVSHQLSAFGSLAFTNTQSMSVAYKIICERLWQISYWAVRNLTNNEDIGISKTKTSKNASKQTNSIILSTFYKLPPPPTPNNNCTLTRLIEPG